jgi:hypothetical protein
MTSKSDKPTPGSAAAFLAAGSDLGRDRSPMLKLTTGGEWVAGVDNTRVTQTRFAADVHGAETGFTCFLDKKVVDEMMVAVALGTKISQGELPNHGPYGDGDGWRAAACIRLRSLTTGEEFVFKTTSQGGRSAIGDLLTKYAGRLAAGKGGMPIIDLAVDRYTHKRHGLVYRPLFRIVDWQDDADAAAVTSGEEGHTSDARSLAEELGDDDIPF